MTSPWTPDYLSARSRSLLAETAMSANVIDDDFTSTFTPFSGFEAGDPASFTGDAFAAMRTEIAKALDRLDAVVTQVLQERKAAENSASTWIMIGGVVVVALVLLAAIAPLVTSGGVLPSVFSSLSVGGLMILLYAPVREKLAIANDRSNLLLMTQGFRLQFAAANTVEQLQALGRELTAALQISNRSS